MARRPTFFLSSTIYDFKDLRGAIKFSLEARGCRVLASEFNDFAGNLALHSYEACLENITQADYFVLLIGSRVGGWYDASARISITQQEYRAAYELHRQGRLRLVSLVRQEVWQLKEDRRELAKHLANLSLEDSEREAIVASPSKFATDAEFVSAFLTEVGRNAETGHAVRTGGAKPTGNWIHQFRDFRDIHDVLGPLAFTGLTSEDAAYRKALETELLIVMSRLLEKQQGTIQDPRNALKRGLDANPITMETRLRPTQTIDLEAWNGFSSVFVILLGLRFDTVVIDDALTSTIFMDYDPELGGFHQSAAYEALSSLWDEILRFNSMATTETLSLIYETSPRTLGRKTGKIELGTEKVASLYSLAHRWINIVTLCEALILHLSGHPFQAPELMPFSPVKGFDDRIHQGRVSPAELRALYGIS